MDVEEIFADELQKIQSVEIREFVIKCFDELCPDYFWTCPSSTSGKYHPKVSLGKGGLVRHTKLAVWWGLELIKALSSQPELKEIPEKQLQDEVIAALLLHDLIKNGKGLDINGRSLESGVTGTHGITLVAKILNNTTFCNMFEDDSTFDRIFEGISCHMGIWTTDPNYRPFGDFTYLVHLADYCASRKVDDKVLELGEII